LIDDLQCPQCGVFYAKAEQALFEENNRLYDAEAKRLKGEAAQKKKQNLKKYMNAIVVFFKLGAIK
jgi:hypothetical protein